MEAEQPAMGISRRGSNEDLYTSYHIECECTCPEHALETLIEISRDREDDYFVEVIMFSKFCVPFKVVSVLKDRLWVALKFIFTGQMDVEYSLMLREQAAKNFAHALLGSIEKYEDKIENAAVKNIYPFE